MKKKGLLFFIFVVFAASSVMAAELQNDPTAWAYYTVGKSYTSWGAGGDYMAWLKSQAMTKTGSPWSYGVGLFGTYDNGQVKDSTYEWTNFFIGPQLGVQYNNVDKNERSYQIQSKFRIGYEYMSGHNDEGYHMRQDNLKLGLYSEFIKQTGKKNDVLWGLTGEGWFAPSKSISSSWSGDRPSGRTTLGIGTFYQKKFHPKWAYRVGAGLFTDTHDLGFLAYAQLRYNETLMFTFGPSFFDGGTSWTGSIQIQGGHFLRKLDAEKRAKRIELKKQSESAKIIIAEDSAEISTSVQSSQQISAVKSQTDEWTENVKE